MISPPRTTSAFSARQRRAGGLALVMVMWSCCAGAAERKTILLLQQASSEREAAAEFLTGFQDELARLWPDGVTVRTEDIAAAHSEDARFHAWLKYKYEYQPFDVIAALEGPVTKFGVSLRETLHPGAPVVLSGMSAARYQELAGRPNVTGVTLDQNVNGLLQGVRRLCPQAGRLHFVSGSYQLTDAARKMWRQEAEEFAAAAGMEFVDLTGMGWPDLLERARTMPPHSILLRKDILTWGSRRSVSRASALDELSAVARGPLFTIGDADVADGSAGKGAVHYGQLGAETAAQTVAVFKAGSAAAVPAVKSAAFTISYDWRQLRRWGLDENLLPPGSAVRFRQPGLWEAHRATMIGITVALAVQTGLIVALLLQRRWRKRAESALQQQREQLSHTLRLATMSQMAASLAHELNQPLTAIVNNAGAACRMIARGQHDPEQLGEMLQDITDDGHRAGEVIRGIRSMVRREESARQTVSVAALIAGARRMMDAEARARGCTIADESAPDLPALEVHPVQLQQVLLNLLMNALDALDMPGATARRVVIRAEAEGAGTVCVSVRDFGPGLPPEGAEKWFEQYYTTKPNGMGMGLVIVRSLIEAHGGSLSAATAEGGGARFSFRLPAAKSPAT